MASAHILHLALYFVSHVYTKTNTNTNMNTNTKWLLIQSIVLLKRQKVSVHLPSAVSNLAHLSEKPPNYFSSPVKQTHGLYFLEIYFRSSALQPVGPSSKSRQSIEAECWRNPQPINSFCILYLVFFILNPSVF